MKRWFHAAAILVFAIGCDSENKKTYEFSGYWTFAGVSDICTQPLSEEYGGGELEFETIEIKVYKDEKALEAGEVYRETSTDCADGEFMVEDLERGTYQVTVSAMAKDPDGEIVVDAGVDDEVELDDDGPTLRAYYERTQEVVVPPRDDEPVEFEMRIGTGSIEVSWDFETGQCASDWNQVTKVSVVIKGSASGKKYESEELDCAITKWKVDDLVWDVYTVTITGYDEDGNKTHEGSFENPLEIRPGTHVSGRDGLILLEEI